MYSKILVPIDGSEVSDAGAAEALGVAARMGASVRFFNVIDLTYLGMVGGGGTSFDTSQLTEVSRKEAGKLLAQAMERANAAGVKAETGCVEIVAGRAADQIVLEAERCGAQLIVMGTHGRRGFSRAMLGSDAESVVRHAAVPVLLVPLRKT
jgi:nucleotide-binding universal stress UspA family protein